MNIDALRGGVPRRHTYRPAQSRRGKRAGERAPTAGDHGQWGAQQRESTTIENTGYFGTQEGGNNAMQNGGTTFFPPPLMGGLWF